MKKLIALCLLTLLTACQSQSTLQGHYFNGHSQLYGHDDIRIFYQEWDDKHINIQNNIAYTQDTRPQLADYYLPGLYTVNEIIEENGNYTLKLELFDDSTGQSIKKVDYHFTKQGDKYIDDNKVEFELRKIIKSQ